MSAESLGSVLATGTWICWGGWQMDQSVVRMVDWALRKRFQIRNAAESVMGEWICLKDFDVLPVFTFC